MIQLPASSHPTGLHFIKRNPNPSKVENRSDCGTRAICLATDRDYHTVWNEVTRVIRRYESNPWSGHESRATANGGASRAVMQQVLGTWRWNLGSVLHIDEVPRLCIVFIPGHWACVRDGAVLDTWDCRGKRRKPRAIRGYLAPA
jgi:hypothetical protein